MPYELGAVRRPEKKPLLELRWSRRGRVTGRERMFLTEQLVLLLETGVPLHPALEALRRQVENPAMAEVIEAVRDEIASGRPFSEALSKHPTVFSETYVRLVEAGERGGFLHQVLTQLHDMEARWLKLRSSLASAVSYPAFLAFFSAAIVLFIVVVVYPKFGEHFRSIRDQLPFSTLFLMDASDFLRERWVACLVGTAVCLLGLNRLAALPAAARRLDVWKLGAPVIGALLVRVYLVQTLWVLSLSLRNGVGILDALKACEAVVPNCAFRALLGRVEEAVRDGRGFARGFQDTGFIPPVVRQMVSTGEETGSLATVMGRLAEFYELEVERKLAAIAKTLEPTMLLIMGVLVGLIVSSLVLPIFKLSGAVR
ncbi:MAG: type II secretion system F family protein [Deltaproteobacteria bacterium]|nr:type II secretion system F family protein [Deltaproteobacteria bacterium]